MKTRFLLSIAASLLLISCASSKFQAFEGSVPTEQLCTLSIDPVENGSVTIATVNGVAANTTEALFKGATENQVALTFKNKDGELTQTLSFTAPEGKNCKASATTEERNYKMGSAELRTYAVLWIECAGSISAGSDHSDNMEQVQ